LSDDIAGAEKILKGTLAHKLSAKFPTLKKQLRFGDDYPVRLEGAPVSEGLY
jgi:hypothetical protein